MTNKKNDLVKPEASGLPISQDEMRTIDAMFPVSENMDMAGGNPTFPRYGIVKDAAMFQNMVTEETFKTLDAIITPATTPNALWLPPGHDEKNPDVIDTKIPDCSSPDGIIPMRGYYSNNCVNCKFNQYKSVSLLKGEPGRGKACKNCVLLPLFIVPENFMAISDVTNFNEIISGIPYILTAPPTSKKTFNIYLTQKLSAVQGLPLPLAITRLSLKKITEPFTYSVIEFQFVASLKPILYQSVEVARFYQERCQQIKDILLGTNLVDKEEVSDPEVHVNGEPW